MILVFPILFFFGFSRQGFSGFGACPGTSSCRPGWSRTHRDSPASASRVLGLNACATTARPCSQFLYHDIGNHFRRKWKRRVNSVISLHFWWDFTLYKQYLLTGREREEKINSTSYAWENCMKNFIPQKGKEWWTNWVYWCIVALTTTLRKQRWIYLSLSWMSVQSMQSGPEAVAVHFKTLSPLQNSMKQTIG